MRPLWWEVETMKTCTAVYHTTEWALLVEMGWITKEVIYGPGSWRIAIMVKPVDRNHE
jgi:hypothetical protein